MRLPKDLGLIIGALLVAGALFNHFFGHSVLLVELIFIATGALFFLYGLLQKTDKEIKKREGILISLLSKVLSKEQCGKVIPFVGFLLLILWSLYKIVIIGTSNLTMDDIIMTLLSISLILYYSGPSKYQREKDFIVLYLIFLAITFEIIIAIFIFLSGNSWAVFSAYSEYYLVTQPVVFFSNIFGANVNAVLDMNQTGISNFIEYWYQGHLLRLGIGITCSGIYTIGLFFSAFLAFVLVKYQKMDRYIATSLALGLFITWAANIVRMVITVVIGAYYGFQALAVVHMYIGIVIFVIFASVFWFLIVRWLDKKEITPSVSSIPDDSEKITETN